VTRRYGPVLAVDGIDLDVAKGEFLSILGPSGCGKSTLLKIVGGLDESSGGTVRIGDVDVTGLSPERRPTATVFQGGAVFPHLSVYDNIAYPLSVRRVPRRDRRTRVAELLGLVRLDELADRYPAELSGGQLQRVAVARALAADPQVLLMDEPLSALDAALKRELQIELRRIHRAVGVTVLFVTHDQEEALVLSDRVAVMKDGRIQQCDAPSALYSAPANAFVARFLGHANVLSLTRLPDAGRSAVQWGGYRFDAVDAAAFGENEKIGVSVRPATMRVHSAGTPNVALGHIVDVVYLGDAIRLQIEVAAEIVWAEVRGNVASAYSAGAEVGIDFDPVDAAVVPLDPAP
jgi:putative spermidine/putrescine transport system ATP-binding protein